jgi:glycosyltransferase involved in cell wall biosynthesis
VGRHVILYAGRLFEYKGVLNLIKAFAKFIQTNSKALLFVVYPSSSAEPGMERKMISLIKHLGVKKNTRIKKDPPKHNLIQYYKNSDVLVLPSKLENSPLVVLESLASGTPVIGTPVGNLKELLGKLDSTLILKNDSPEEILLKLNTFFSMPTNNRKVLGKRSIKLAKRFSEAQALASFGKVIKNIYL